jgi:hypothetical protein
MMSSRPSFLSAGGGGESRCPYLSTVVGFWRHQDNERRSLISLYFQLEYSSVLKKLTPRVESNCLATKSDSIQGSSRHDIFKPF